MEKELCPASQISTSQMVVTRAFLFSVGAAAGLQLSAVPLRALAQTSIPAVSTAPLFQRSL